jgi:sigma-E factor negative regulatory protein RseC
MDGRGIVVSVKGNKASVQVSGEAGCAGCAGKAQCYSAGNQGREITVLNDFGAGVSDRVVFEADPGKVILSAALIWVVPLLAMIVGYLAGERLGGGFIPIAAAFLFMGFTFFLLKLLDRAISGGRSFYPRITAVLDSGDDASTFCER